MAELTRANVNVPMTATVDSDDKHPSKSVPIIEQSGIGLPERQYYLEGDPVAEIRRAYEAYLTRLLTLAGENNAAARAKAVLALETGIARTHWDRVDTRDADKTYNRLEPARLATAPPASPGRAYLRLDRPGGQPALFIVGPGRHRHRPAARRLAAPAAQGLG